MKPSTMVTLFKGFVHIWILWHLWGETLAPIPFGMQFWFVRSITVKIWLVICHAIVRMLPV